MVVVVEGCVLHLQASSHHTSFLRHLTHLPVLKHLISLTHHLSHFISLLIH